MHSDWQTAALVSYATLAACLFGPAIALNGLRYIIRNRRIYNTPLSKIGSAAIGDIAIEGRSEPYKLIRGPVFGELCCWWRCWVNRAAQNAPPPVESHGFFYLKDDTGHILINPALGGKYPIVSTKTDEDVVVDRFARDFSVFLPSAIAYRLIEERLPPDAPLYLYAGLGRGRDSSSGNEVMMALKPRVGTYLLCGGNQQGLEHRLKMEGTPLVCFGIALTVAATAVWLLLHLPVPVYIPLIINVIGVFLGFRLPLEDPDNILTVPR